MWVASARASFRSPGDLPYLSTRDVTTRRAHCSPPFCKCVHVLAYACEPSFAPSALVTTSSVVACIHVHVQSSDNVPFPCAGQAVSDLSGSETLRPMAKRRALLHSEWLFVFRVRTLRKIGRLLSRQKERAEVSRPQCTSWLEWHSVLRIAFLAHGRPSKKRQGIPTPTPPSCKMNTSMLPLAGLFLFILWLQGWVTLKFSPY
jgi:hypothetical protein